MKRIVSKRNTLISFLVTFSLLIGGGIAHAVFIPGATGPNFNLTAKAGYIYADDGNSIGMWGFANGPLPQLVMQYPGRRLIVNQGQTVSVTLNQLPGANCSIVFPGQTTVLATGGVQGLLTREAGPGGSVTYSFVASEPGTYTYYSGTRPEIQVEMGLVGALIVRPALGANYGYNHADSIFNHEYLFVLSDIDAVIHQQVVVGQMASVDNTAAFPTYWFITGAGFDTLRLIMRFLPSQPYGASRECIRVKGSCSNDRGWQDHPFCIHGNHHQVIAKTRLLKGPLGEDLQSLLQRPLPGPNLTPSLWTGEGMGWTSMGTPTQQGQVWWTGLR
jgi:FtsP/CotA-like multicopper oxidase with cupredoxin domain